MAAYGNFLRYKKKVLGNNQLKKKLMTLFGYFKGMKVKDINITFFIFLLNQREHPTSLQKSQYFHRGDFSEMLVSQDSRPENQDLDHR